MSQAAPAVYWIYVVSAAAAFFLFASVAAAVSKNGQGEDVTTASDKVKQFANAIAVAEGYMDTTGNVISGNRPARNNNPGDFIGSGDAGSEGGYAVYSTPEKGFERLYGQLSLIVNGPHTPGKISGVPLDGTISDLAYVWTATQQDAWSENVASYLGVTRDTPLRGLLT